MISIINHEFYHLVAMQYVETMSYSSRFTLGEVKSNPKNQSANIEESESSESNISEDSQLSQCYLPDKAVQTRSCSKDVDNTVKKTSRISLLEPYEASVSTVSYHTDYQ